MIKYNIYYNTSLFFISLTREVIYFMRLGGGNGESEKFFETHPILVKKRAFWPYI